MTKLKWGMIGGGAGSQIGPAHRLGASLDGLFEFTAGALDHRPEEGVRYGQTFGLGNRAYGSWQEMLSSEKALADPVDLVTIATPNSTHFEITKAFLEGGFHVLCEKPMTMTVEEAEEIVKISDATRKICAVNYGYSGYSLVRHMRAMVTRGDIGKIRLINAEFAHGHHADAADADNPRVRWRYDPKQAGVSAQFADCGIHALHMASFVTGQVVTKLSADIVSCISVRELEDDAMVNFRMDGGAVGRLWTSSIAIGRQHGLGIQVFGEKGGLRWSQEQPNQLFYMPLGGRMQVIERGEENLSPEADRATRVTIGHSEGMPLAFANIYTDLAEAIRALKGQRDIDPSANLYPRAEDGLRSMAAVFAVAKSGKQKGTWVDARPPMFR
ncbi:MAG: Gfo/Idh/MocA family oxidoreductase [Planktomarina sp.]|nr:Gfo/Idh/MocA family oxidoreductase [Planktomarina sp.]MDT2033433.1 Gfo/Idh/MocA family oxidoreductase [Planktomarina sp.]MDT2039399.1 Gfo/Idh/MocA family oxidoreductase [Planktomarina sp.]MDT2049462.1 Gfo/Idh/MocA family oxidoreductase [Planktomarina sp.]|tara:strand:+ start:2089 stop:3243 length:1155 start_codon:yes stop_codon:yes gene_type:complete